MISNFINYFKKINKNFLYIEISKSSDSNLVYTKVEGQFSFVSMDYIYAVVPENFYYIEYYSLDISYLMDKIFIEHSFENANIIINTNKVKAIT